MRGLAAIVLVVASVGASGAFAHGGGLDALGCHNDRKAGVYHCHKGVKSHPIMTPPESLR